MTVLVTGATGNIGREVVAALGRRNVPVRAFARDPAAARARLGSVDIVRGDFGDVRSIRAALQGIDRVFLACANDPRQVEYETRVIDAAIDAGVMVAKLSAAGARAGSPLDFSDWHGRIERHLVDAGARAVILQPGFYMSNVFLLPRALRAGRLVAPAGQAPIVMIDPRDVGEAAAVVLTGSGHEGRSYVLTGAQAITYEQAARELSAASGRPIALDDVADDVARHAMLDEGHPPWLVDNFIRLFGYLRQGAAARATDTLASLTGAAPRAFADFARDRAAWFDAG
jgi:uncharacterized protein YbjT (DUF2867 family)